ncbi:MAG TPA: TIR domain-containing protein, partial [Thermoanaerobaculia bacterium]|nr:TIR domain-containing protein [Thermoanaerobaculia bacterium]
MGSSSAEQQNFATRVFGFDVFLSFALGPPPRGTLPYAADLARRLRERDLTVFFSEDELAPGEQLSGALRTALHRAKVLIVVANRETLADPRWVRTEVDEFRRRHPERPVVVINVDGALRDPALAEDVERWLGFGDKKWIDESGEAVRSGTASSSVVEALVITPARTRSNLRWRWLARGVLSVLVVLVVGLALSLLYSVLQQKRVVGSLSQARAALDRATALRLAGESAPMLSSTHPEAAERGLQQLVAAVRLPSGAEGEVQPSLLSALLQLRDLRKLIPAGTPIQAVAYSPDGRRVVAGGADGTLRIWDAESGQPIGAPLVGHQKPVSSVAYSPDGRRIVSGSDDSTLRIWDAATGQPLGAPLDEHHLNVNCVVYSPDGNRIVSGSSDWTLRMWDAETGQPVGAPLAAPPGEEQVVDAVAFSPDGRRLVSGGRHTFLTLWDAGNGRRVRMLEGSGFVASVAFSPDGRRIVSAGWDKTLHIWDAETGRPVGSPLAGHSGPLTSVAYSPDGRWIVSGSNDKTVRLWDAATGAPIGKPLEGHKGPVTSVAYSVRGRRIVSGSADATLRLWTTDTGMSLGTTLEGPEGAVSRVAYSPDGRRIASGLGDASLGMWDAETGKLVGASSKGHTQYVTSVAWSRDGRRIVTGGWD